ncbi:MAG: amidohydrolase [Thiothrix sp.]|nr:MAG: amidohydrolase [Thiothrix sp.]
MLDNALEPSNQWHEEMQTWRRDLHQHPEIAYEEHRTSQKVAEILKDLGLEVHTGLGQTGVLGILKGKQVTERHIALRADMDALKLTELNTFAHASCHTGQMHGCGHDGHTAMLLGAAKALAKNPDFAGTVYFVFQPAEEGERGALRMLEDGLFKQFPIQDIYGMHNWPGLPAGEFAVHSGPVMAAINGFDITIKGTGGHGGMPEQVNDPIIIAAQLINAVQTVISRNLSPVHSGVISITQIQGGSGAYNVIPETVTLRGAIRTFYKQDLALIYARLRTLVEHTAAAFNAEASIEFLEGASATVNHPEQAEQCYEVVEKLVGKEKAHWNPEPSMGAEDFAYFLLERPGAYIWIGNNGLEHSHSLHSPYYDFNDEILALGASYWVNLVKHLSPLDEAL